jgi:hypothetical protein
LLAANTVTLTPLATPGKLQSVLAVIEVEGELRLNADGQGVKTRPMRVTANLAYDEKTLTAEQGQLRHVVRHYKKAEADIKIASATIKNTLRDDVKLVCVDVGEESATVYSPLGPMLRDELELIKVPGEPAVWNGLLPTQPVKVGETWKPADTTLAKLLSIEVVTQANVTAKLVEVKAGMAALELEGTVAGAIGGIATDINLKAKYNFDLTKRQVTWLALGLAEKRAIGHAEPGYEITARVRVSQAPLATSAELADSLLKSFDLTFRPGSTLLTHDSAEGAFQLLHDRRWHVMADHRDATILRLIDHGDLIAQCNITRLRDQPADKKLALDAFQQEITGTLGKNFEQVVNAEESTTDNGLRQLQVIIAGQAQDVPVQWTYYHLTDSAGHSTSMVFTMDARLAERFAELDRSLVGTLVMRPRPIDEAEVATPTAGSEPAAAKSAREQPAAVKTTASSAGEPRPAIRK